MTTDTGITTLTDLEIMSTAGGCDDIYECSSDAGQWMANKLEDAWEWLTGTD